MEHFFPTIHLFGIKGLELNVTVALMSLIASVFVALISLAAVRRLEMRRPGKMQNFLEMLVDFIRGLAKDTIGTKHAEAWVPLGLTLFIWMFIANQMGLIGNLRFAIEHPSLGISAEQLAEAGGHGEVSLWMSPTADISVAMAMGIAMVLLSHFVGLQKPGSYFKHWVTPLWMFPIHLIEELPKFLTLGLRLFGNIFAGEVLVGVIIGIPLAFGWVGGSVIGGIPMFIWLGYSILVGTIQAFVFTVLTLVYVGQKIPHDNH
jgi:F-type H+-transporting ATPase subunit a